MRKDDGHKDRLELIEPLRLFISLAGFIAIMSIRIKPNSSVEEVKKALEKLRNEQVIPDEKNLVRHFGKLKRGLDGMEYQNAMRNEIS